MPDGTMALIINLHEDAISVYDPHQPRRRERLSGTLLAGARTEFSVIDTECQIEIMGVQFTPGGAFPFLPVSAGELSNIDVNLETLWGARVQELRGQLVEARTVAEKFRRLETSLLAIFSPARARHPAVAFALRAFHTPEPAAVTDVVGRTGFSARHFIELFTTEVGLTPKRYLRVQRFQRVIQQLHTSAPINLADAALICGYYDQSHFIHDFRAFSGLSPTDYLARRGAHANHVALED